MLIANASVLADVREKIVETGKDIRNMINVINVKAPCRVKSSNKKTLTHCRKQHQRHFFSWLRSDGVSSKINKCAPLMRRKINRLTAKHH